MSGPLGEARDALDVLASWGALIYTREKRDEFFAALSLVRAGVEEVETVRRERDQLKHLLVESEGYTSHLREIAFKADVMREAVEGWALDRVPQDAAEARLLEVLAGERLGEDECAAAGGAGCGCGYEPYDTGAVTVKRWFCEQEAGSPADTNERSTK